MKVYRVITETFIKANNEHEAELKKNDKKNKWELIDVHEYENKNEQKIKTETIDVLEHVKPNKDCELCDTYDSGYTCIACEGDQVKEKYPNAYTNDEGIWEVREEIKI